MTVEEEVKDLRRRLDLLEKGDYSGSPFAVALIKRLEAVENEQKSGKLTKPQLIALLSPALVALTIALFNLVTKAPAHP